MPILSNRTAKLDLSRPGRRDVSFAAGTTTLGEEYREHRRSRLTTAAVILLACFGVVFVTQIIAGALVWWAQAIGLLVILGGAVTLLMSQRTLGARQLGIIELAIVGAPAASIAGRHYALMVHLAEIEDRARLLTSAAGVVVGFFTIIVIYGLIIPNSWKRTAGVVALLVIWPLLEPFVLQRFEPRVLELAPELVEPELVARHGVFLLVGAIVAVYGTHLLNSLRRAVQDAEQIGQYKLERKIGEGGMGEVWEARHALLARPAAIKLIKLDKQGASMESSQTSVARFEREATVTANLRCPHTVQVFDFGTTSDGSCYYAMEFLKGLDLDSLIEKHGLVPAERVVWIWIQVCRSLAEAHDSGLVHRDIKPANIFLCHLGLAHDFVKVLDFGLVTFQEGAAEMDAKLTQAGVLGTPAFISPEAMLGHDITNRSDVYSTACVAYWLLTGEYVFKGTAMEMATGHARIDPRRPSVRTDNEIPEQLEEIVLRCMSKAPSERPDAAALARELEATGLADGWSEARREKWWQLHML